MRLQTYTFTALEAAMASGIPRTSRFGTRLVNRDPGPMVIMSALAIASSVSGKGFASSGTICRRAIRKRLAVIFVSPKTVEPSFIRASSCTFAIVEGKIVPRVARIFDDSRTASAKSPVTAVRAVTKRLPKLWPSSPPPVSKRY